MKTSFGTAKDLERALKQIFATMIQGNAEMASEQESAVAISTQHTKSELESLSLLVGETKDTVAMLTDSIVCISRPGYFLSMFLITSRLASSQQCKQSPIDKML